MYQVFQNGQAFYVPNTNSVYFLNNNTQVRSYGNNWTPGVVIPTIIPPSGLVDPDQQIGNVWHTQTWVDGNSLMLMFGWALGPQQGYSGIVQVGTPATDVYIRRPDGTVYKVSTAGNGNWGIAGNAP